MKDKLKIKGKYLSEYITTTVIKIVSQLLHFFSLLRLVSGSDHLSPPNLIPIVACVIRIPTTAPTYRNSTAAPDPPAASLGVAQHRRSHSG
ncbi:hypothetical protein J4Q44_G00010910 [Coregonus suidteri]|uniref:Uncharacterized protein n=1 Tax=Coregonus suidteri TaxID=861788 RepID=A0AAN8MFE8_9TELE